MNGKYLLVYYSRSGYTRKAAEEIARHLDCDIEEITEKKERSGPLGYLGGIKDSLLEKKGGIDPPQHDPSEYDAVIIGTPVWANKPSLPVLEWINQLSGGITDTAFFLTTRISGIKSTFKHMEELTGSVPLATLALKDGEMKKPGWKKRAEEFAKSIGLQRKGQSI